MQFYGCFAPAVTGPPERWRNLPPDWPHWQAVYYYFDRWKAKGTFEQMNAALNQLNRVNAGREAYPSALCIDSQSVKLSPLINSYRGTDPHKRINAGPPVRA